MIDYPKTKEFLRVYEAITGRLFTYSKFTIQLRPYLIESLVELERGKHPFFIEEEEIKIFSVEFDRAFDFLNSHVPIISDELEYLVLNITGDKYKIIRESINSVINGHREAIAELSEYVSFKRNTIRERTKNYEIWEDYSLRVCGYLQVVEQFYWKSSEITGENNHNLEITGEYNENPYSYIEIKRDRKGNAVSGTNQRLLLFFTYLDDSLLNYGNRNNVANWFQISLERFEKTCGETGSHKSWFKRYCNEVRVWIEQTNKPEIINKFNLDFPQ